MDKWQVMEALKNTRLILVGNEYLLKDSRTVVDMNTVRELLGLGYLVRVGSGMYALSVEGQQALRKG